MDPETATHMLCEPERSKCIWTCHRHFLTRKFIGQMPQTKAATHMHLDMSQEQFYAEICRKNGVPQRQHQDKVAALTPNERTVQRGHISWGTIVYGMGPHFGTKMK